MVLATLISIAARWLGHQSLTAAYAGSLVIAIMIAGKLGQIPPIPDFSLSASIFVYSSTFIFSDVLSEVYGKTYARRTVMGTALLYPLIYFMTQLSVAWSPHPVWEANQEAFASTLTTTVRITIASFCAFVVSQLHDVWAFDFWRKRTNEKYLWWRNNASTMTSQLIDTIIFYTIGFWGIFPVGRLIILTYLVKLVIAAIDTPAVYLIVRYLRRHAPTDCVKSVSRS